MAELVAASFRAWRPLFEQIPGCRMDEVGTVMRWTSDVPLPYFNGAFGAPDGVDVDTVLDAFADGRPLLWAAPADEELIAELESRGFEVERMPGMAVALRDLPPLELPPGVELRVVDADHELLTVATRIAMTANGFPETAVAPFVHAVERFADGDSMRTFLALVDGEPAATSLLSTLGGSAGLYNVGTLEEFRGRGLGRAVSLAALQAGRDAGHDTGVLIASAMGEPVYRKIGFADAGRFVFAIRV
jgi:GNAT superfamily N-acetyltransferase